MNYILDILLIDDQLEEAYDIQKNLLKEGYNPAISLPQDITESYPVEPSIVFCDINLHGDNDDLNQKTILGLLKKIYKKNTPYIFIAWTSHPEKLDRLKNYLEDDPKVFKPIKYLSIDKESFKNEEFTLIALLEDLYKSFPNFITHIMLRHVISKSNYDAIFLLNKLYNLENVDFRKLILSIVSVNIGEQNLSKNEYIGLTTPISYFVKDRIERNIYDQALRTDIITLLNETKPLGNQLNQALKAKINTIMHINTNIQDNITIPGDFVKTKINTIKELLGNKKITKKIILEKILKKGALTSTCQLGLIEISADCDFANCKTMGICKYALAYLCPPEIVKKDKLAECFQSFDIEYNKKLYKLIVDARFLISSNHNDIRSSAKLFSIRESLFKKIRQDVYIQNSRIGTISF